MYLSEWIPDDHLVRVISEIVDQPDLQEIIKDYSTRGEEAYHFFSWRRILFYGLTISTRSRTGLFHSGPMVSIFIFWVRV